MLVAASEAERVRVELSIRRSLMSFGVASVEYLLPASMEMSELAEGDGVRQVEAGIVLRGVDGERVVRWSMEGEREALWLSELLTNDGLLWAPDVWRVPVGEPWSVLTGASIKNVAIGWQRVSDEIQSVWSLRLDTACGSVVLALGEIDWESGRLSYIPDCVVAIFDAVLAEGYRPKSSVVSAWGADDSSHC